MSFPPVAGLLQTRKERVLREVIREVGKFPWSPYREFLLKTREGRSRLRTWLDLYIQGLEGNADPFVRDQERIGYQRSEMEGFALETLTGFYSVVPRILWRMIQAESRKMGSSPADVAAELKKVYDLLFWGYSAIATSYFRSRENRIAEKVNQLEDLNRFTRELITQFDLGDLVPFFLRRIVSVFRVDAAVMALFRDGEFEQVYGWPEGSMEAGWKRALARVLARQEEPFVEGKAGKDGFAWRYPMKRAVAVPILAHGRMYGVLCLQGRRRGEPFLEGDLGLLSQFLQIMAVALENVYVLRENREAGEQLHLLTGRMITIQEEERRRLAAEIHDTFTQALIGIAYKLQYS